ncbi:alpha/beta-type small acid-soluble spore protein [Fodinisporobacter ferrooxydans]|uniref:Alpha/beta-type small acid-soluble spore protein n=1 Tax=Fodinisporobacter ferrooxydans TaxID=2901836 RepID=A0ABY4CLR4_9BACL|nr:alpha/beta-type small acid-soluble spore protein [Alicyclobacillaceae bacterium MYW30-H2]
MANRKRSQLVPSAHKALDDMKYEIAAELGINVYQGSEDYWGHVTTREAGSVGGSMTKKLVAFAEQALQQQNQ